MSDFSGRMITMLGTKAEVETNSPLVAYKDAQFAVDSSASQLGILADNTWTWISSGSSTSASTVAVSPDYILIQDQKSSGTAGGTFTSGAWRTRDLNTEVSDSGNHASVASNQITLAAGTYQFRISAPALYVNAHQAKLYNVTDSSDVALGQTSQSCPTGNGDVTCSVISGVFTISSAKVFEVRHQCVSTEASDGFGFGASWGTNIYTSCEFWKTA